VQRIVADELCLVDEEQQPSRQVAQGLDQQSTGVARQVLPWG